MKRWKAGEMTLRAALEMKIHVLIYWDSRCWTDVSLSTNLIVILICYHSSPSTTSLWFCLKCKGIKQKYIYFFLQKIKSEPRVLFQRVCLIQAYKSLVSVQVQASWDPKEHKTAWATYFTFIMWLPKPDGYSRLQWLMLLFSWTTNKSCTIRSETCKYNIPLSDLFLRPLH